MVSVFEASSCLLASALFLLASPCAQAAPFSSWAGKRSAPLSLLHRPAPATQDLAQLIHDLRELYMLQGGTSPPGMEAADYAEEPTMDEQMEKRAPFSSWAGKRAPFSSWAGKRAPFSSWAGKRAPFSSWAGKRSAPSYDDDADAASSDEGKLRLKRSSDESGEFSRDTRSGNSFSAWGGKRVPLLRFTRNAPVAAPSANQLVPVSRLRPQRAAFSAWGG